MTIWKTAIATVALCAGAAVAAPISDTYVLPIAGHVRGANGDVWTTDVTLHNPSSATLVVALTGIATDGAALAVSPEVVSIPSHGTVVLRDVVQSPSIGALLVTSDSAFAITSRVSAQRTGGAVGADITAASEFIDRDSPEALLAGLSSNERSRTNIGLLAIPGVSPLSVDIALLDGNGATLGTKSFTFPADAAAHMQISSDQLTTTPFDTASARVTMTSPDGAVIAYASVVDNRSGDASFIPAAVIDRSSQQTSRLKALIARGAH